MRDYDRETLDVQLAGEGFTRLDPMHYAEDTLDDVDKPQRLILTIQKNCCVPTYKLGIIKGEEYLGVAFRDLKKEHFPPDAWVLNAMKQNSFDEEPCMFYGYKTYAADGFRIPGRAFDISFATSPVVDSKEDDSRHLADVLASCLLYVVKYVRN